MTLGRFLAQEAEALRAFMNENAAADFLAKTGTFAYQRFYTCEQCGARQLDPRDAWEHRCSFATGQSEQLSFPDMEVG